MLYYYFLNGYIHTSHIIDFFFLIILIESRKIYVHQLKMAFYLSVGTSWIRYLFMKKKITASKRYSIRNHRDFKSSLRYIKLFICASLKELNSQLGGYYYWRHSSERPTFCLLCEMKKPFSGVQERGEEAITLKKQTGFANCTINTFEEQHHYTIYEIIYQF